MTNTHKVKLYWSIGFIVFVGSILLGIFGYVFGAVTMSLYLYMAYKVGTLIDAKIFYYIAIITGGLGGAYMVYILSGNNVDSGFTTMIAPTFIGFGMLLGGTVHYIFESCLESAEKADRL